MNSNFEDELKDVILEGWKIEREEVMSRSYRPSSMDGERLAYIWLKDNNWSPVKINKIFGAPDFKCSENRWVEAKGISHKGTFVLALHQLVFWQTLIDSGDKVFLMFYNTENRSVSMPLDVCCLSLESILSVLENMDTKEEIKRIIKGT